MMINYSLFPTITIDESWFEVMNNTIILVNNWHLKADLKLVGNLLKRNVLWLRYGNVDRANSLCEFVKFEEQI